MRAQGEIETAIGEGVGRFKQDYIDRNRDQREAA
jgi:hypothetical protein